MTLYVYKARAKNTSYPIYVVANGLTDAVELLAKTEVYANPFSATAPNPFHLESIEQLSEDTSHVVIAKD